MLTNTPLAALPVEPPPVDLPATRLQHNDATFNVAVYCSTARTRSDAAATVAYDLLGCARHSSACYARVDSTDFHSTVMYVYSHSYRLTTVTATD